MSDFTGSVAIVYLKLAIDTPDLRANGIDGDYQLASNLSIRASGNEQAQDTLLLRREWIDEHFSAGHRCASVALLGTRKVSQKRLGIAAQWL
jgi:hypothetical protein